MRIYIASSWKNYHCVELVTHYLEESGHKVMSFVRRAVEDEGRGNLKFDVDAWIMSASGEDKFNYDTESAMNADVVIYVGPSGVDAWAEVGAAWAKGVPILGLWTKGEQSGLMRRMVSWYKNVFELLKDINDAESKLTVIRAR
jgi:hypothetical protein